MKTPEEALTQIAQLKGHVLAHDVFIEALLRALPANSAVPRRCRFAGPV